MQNRLIVSDSRHQKGVRNFRRIVFHSLFKLKVMLPFLRDRSGDKRQRGSARLQEERGPALARLRRSSALFEPKINQRASTNLRSWKKFVRENFKRIIFECSNIRCSSKRQHSDWTWKATDSHEKGRAQFEHYNLSKKPAIATAKLLPSSREIERTSVKTTSSAIPCCCLVTLATTRWPRARAETDIARRDQGRVASPLSFFFTTP